MVSTGSTNGATSPPRPGSPRNRLRLAVPPQHGAWAYLALPLLLGLTISGWTWLGVLFALTWVVAYPASYYVGRAVATRWRRGSWSRIAKRERSDAIPWGAATAVGGAVLVLARPWLIVVALLLGVLWFAGIRLALAGRERGIGNDLLLVGQSLVALPLAWLITADTTSLTAVPGAIWLATGVCAVYFVGSVIHVKSLIRESDDRRWHQANIVFHVAAMATTLLSAWLLIPFGTGLVRAIVMKPDLRPALIGAVEIVMSALVAICTLLAV